jgi:putative transposase
MTAQARPALDRITRISHDAHRPHRSLGQRPPARSDATPPTISDVDAARLRRAARLGGLIHEYRMVA